MANKEVLLSVKNLTVEYTSEGEVIHAVNNVSFELEKGKTIGLVGETGAGKTSIARAILRDAPIMLLDEATSALDVATERKVLRNIMTSRPNKTCIVTTHRPSVLESCNRIYGIEDFKCVVLTSKEVTRIFQPDHDLR